MNAVIEDLVILRTRRLLKPEAEILYRKDEEILAVSNVYIEKNKHYKLEFSRLETQKAEITYNRIKKDYSIPDMKKQDHALDIEKYYNFKAHYIYS